MAGATSDFSSPLAFTIDLTAPTATVPASVTAVSAPGSRFGNVVFTATASDNQPGAGVSCTSLSGSAFAIGNTTVTCTATDAAGNTSQASFVVHVDDWALVTVPGLPELSAASDSGTLNNDRLTNVLRPTFAVVAAPGALVELLEGGLVVGSAYAGATGVALVQVAANLAAGVHQFSARVTAAGASTNASTPITVTIDTQGPTGSFTLNGDAGDVVVGGMLATDDPFLTVGLAFSDARGMGQMQFSADGGATWTFAEDYFAVGAVELVGGDGVFTVLVRVTDAAGNVTTLSKQIRLDRSGPKVTVGVANGSVL